MQNLLFFISVSKDSKRLIGWKVLAVFQIGLHLKYLALLISIQQFFKGIGRITHNKAKNEVRFIVTDLNSLVNVIIPHFQFYPLLTQKYIDFYLWVKVINLLVAKQHLTSQGFHLL